MADTPIQTVSPNVKPVTAIVKPTATVAPVVNITQDKSQESSAAAVSVTTPADMVPSLPAAIQQTPQGAQFNINISLNTNAQPDHSRHTTPESTHAVHQMKGTYFKYPIPFRHQRMCTSCLKHKPPLIDIDRGTKAAPISLDSDDEGECKASGDEPCGVAHELPKSPSKALSTGGCNTAQHSCATSQQLPPQNPVVSEGECSSNSSTDINEDGAKRRKLDKHGKPSSSNAQKFNNQTLYYAALKGDVEKVSLLLEGNPDRMNFRVKDSGMTPVHAAVKSGNIDVLKELTRHMGAGTLTLEAMDKELQTPLFYAIRYNKPASLRFLLTQGVNINARDTNARTALHYSCELGNMLCIDMLMSDNRMKVNTQDTDGWTALMWACEYRYFDVVKKLLNRDADAYLRDREQNIALHWASFSGNADIIRLLLTTKCDIDAVNERGDTALHISSRLSHVQCVSALVNSGASIRLPNKHGKTCIDESTPEIIAIIEKLEKDRDSRNFVSVRQPKNTVLHSDISCGKEKIPIPCINEVDDVPAPLDFVYVKESFESSYLCINRNMNNIKSCVCENQCRPGNPCSCFFLTTGSKCVYNKDGRLNTEISDQYNDIVIFECNQRCRCWVNLCRNRVIQKGLNNPLQLFRTNGKGWGVRSPKLLSKGTFICEYIGEIISDSDADRRLNDTYLFDLTVVRINSLRNDNKTIGSIDACHYGNISRFINSSCEPNCVPVKVFVDHQDLRFPRIAFFTTRDVNPYEELTFYYGDSFWDIKKEVLKCCCGACNCISLMSQRDDLQESDTSDVEILE